MTVLKPKLPILNPAHPLARGLVGAWTMHEGNGGYVHDVSKHKERGSLGGNTEWVQTPYGRGVEFAYGGGAGLVNFGSDFPLVKVKSIAMRYWHHTQPCNWPCVLDKGKAQVQDWRIDSGNLYLQVNGNYKVSASVIYNGVCLDVVTINEFSGGNSYMYIDGSLRDTGGGETPTDSGSIFELGGQNADRWIDGVIMYCYLWERPISQSEVHALHSDPYQMFLPYGLSTLAITAAPSPPGTTDISLAWTDNSENEDGFELQRRTDGGAWEVVSDAIAADAESYIDSDVDQDHTYGYRIRALSSDKGDSEWSNIASETV